VDRFFKGSESNWGIWTWPVLLFILISSSLISYYLRTLTNSYLLYLPIALGIVMVHWFGLRVLFLTFINCIFTLTLWEVPGGWGWILLKATREPLVVFASWFFCKNIVYNSRGLSNTRSFVQFTVLGIVVPDLFNSFYVYHYSFISGNLERVFLLWLSDFITMFSIAIPLVHFFCPQPIGKSFKLARYDNREAHLTEGNLISIKELVATTILFLGFSFFIDFDKYWFLYGILAAMVAVRSGFETVVLANFIIFILNYVLPLLHFGNLVRGTHAFPQVASVHLGMGTMFFTSALIGRVITDLKKTESELTRQKGQIEKTNQKLTLANSEMDRFVYSVSHDISAPLKSIKGLIALSRLENEMENFSYLNKIEASVQKLEKFVGEVLDHSRTNRKEVQLENVNLKDLLNDITDNLKYLESFSAIKFTVELPDQAMYTDKFLIKIIVSNLLSNAIKYQKKWTEQVPEIKIKSWQQEGQWCIRMSDNGEGIPDHYKSKIFEMFYRGTTNSTGAGLGLFIAKEAVEKLRGRIEFTSEYGVGSEFTVIVPSNDTH
jgi:two-component system, sensor histidine kinase